MSSRDAAGAASAASPGAAGSQEAPSANPPAYAPGTEATEASLRGSAFAQSEDLEAVHFDYDSSSLKEDALASLKKNAEYLKHHPELEFLVAGHCDDRGTIEYNLALGQRRAKEVRDYYVRLGVSGKSLATISYGKEAPVCQESNEACWAQNRRAETKARSREAGK
ncbi:MAG: peptidoglycan-associated lipoprotein Pal [Elusimicrobia bacterium]|nr:peptidoglycan-associated lipoprotein Pal [Elusimicrobiota bacterium]